MHFLHGFKKYKHKFRLHLISCSTFHVKYKYFNNTKVYLTHTDKSKFDYKVQNYSFNSCLIQGNNQIRI